MKYIKNFIFGSIHGGIMFLSLYLISKFPNLYTLVLGFVVPWFIFLSFYFFVKKTRAWKEPLGFLTPLLMLSQIGLVVIIEHFWIRLFVMLFSGLLFGILYGAGVTHGATLSTLQKPYRRFVMASWVITIYGISSTIFALQIFVPNTVLFVSLLLGGGIILGFISTFIWKMYHQRTQKSFFLWMLIMSFVGIELFYALHFLPLGYLMLGVFLTWSWYLCILFTRFHWDENGIVWKKQMPFLLTNILLFIILLTFFVRWI